MYIDTSNIMSDLPNKQRYRAVNYATFHQHINRISLGVVRTRNGVTRVYNRRRQLVAIIQLPSLINHASHRPTDTPTPRYFLCNTKKLTVTDLLPSLSIAAIWESCKQSMGRALMHGLRPAIQSLGKLCHAGKRPATPRRAPGRRLATRRDPAPVWTTLRLTA